MNKKRILTGIAMICISTLMVSCANSKKVGCYYGEESAKELPANKVVKTATYSIAE